MTPLVAVGTTRATGFRQGTGPGEQKAVNLEANAKVALTTGCNGWERGLDVVVEGEAERVTDAARLAELATAWEEKWDGQWQFRPVAEGFSHEGGEGIVHVFAVRPAKVLAFGKDPFSRPLCLRVNGAPSLYGRSKASRLAARCAEWCECETRSGSD